MEQLSKREEHILLAVGTLGENAYLVAIIKFLSEVTDRSLSIGAVHIPLRRLEKKGLIESFLGESSAVRGGRRKKIYRLTPQAMESLRENKKVNDTLWANFAEFTLK